MTDIRDALREYLETSRAVSLDEAIEVAATSAGRPVSRQLRPLLVAAAAATVVVLFVGGAALLTTGDTAPVVTQPPQPGSTIQGTTLPADTTQPQAPVAPPDVSGQWNVYSSDHGLPGGRMKSVAVGPDGTVWAAQSSFLYRLDGTRWSQVADTPVGGWQWMVATPGGGVAMSVSDGERAHRIVRFDGDQWVSETDDIIYISAVITGGTGPRVLGYDTSDNPVDIRFTDGEVSVKSASRHVGSGVSASFINISDTVDVDSEGTAWYGSVEGAWRFDGDSLELFEFGVHGDCCAPLAVDEHDNVWIQLGPHGDLFVLSPSGQRTQYEPEDGIPFLGQSLVTIVPTSDGSVWVLGGKGQLFPGGVALFDGAAWTSYELDEARTAGIPTMGSYGSFGVVDGPDGSTWTVQRGQGTEPLLHRFLDGRWKAVPTPDISWGGGGTDHGTKGMAVGPDGSLWIPTSTGVAHFQPNGE